VKAKSGYKNMVLRIIGRWGNGGYRKGFKYIYTDKITRVLVIIMEGLNLCSSHGMGRRHRENGTVLFAFGFMSGMMEVGELWHLPSVS
jgi:hypothetical protein